MELDEWRVFDEETGLIFPYYTESFLRQLAKWELKDKVVYEYGMGISSYWWAAKCKMLKGVDSSPEWLHPNGVLETDPSRYPHRIDDDDIIYDIVIIDGIERDRCVAPAMLRLKAGGVLIVDNWDQPSVEETIGRHRDMLLSKIHYIYPQKGHPDWKTAYFII